ncbi:hypothetical protein SeMB42_g02068 [Synchytrium endobioticum]|uniref:Mediator of RNA polymerase II transcription subunit 8 n=1 Tax=Synchytrium endobioticum TaxID=286115 RepID=A0A507C128_9FUNG|nr:hypothetical protein SeLEV6574_g08248 [Synchytrium endobioticum]TPX50941.1 hypothetical protein SeMB42_g02068 [Synchytrium endobioticum]
MNSPSSNPLVSLRNQLSISPPPPPPSPSQPAPWHKDLDSVRAKLFVILRELDRILIDLNRAPEREKMPEIIQRYQSLLLLYRELLAALRRSSLHLFLAVPAHVDATMPDLLPNLHLRTKYTSESLPALQLTHKTHAIQSHPSISSAYNSLDQASISRSYNAWRGLLEAYDTKLVNVRRGIRSTTVNMDWKMRVPRDEDEIEEDPDVVKEKLEAIVKWMSSGPSFVPNIENVLSQKRDNEEKQFQDEGDLMDEKQ